MSIIAATVAQEAKPLKTPAAAMTEAGGNLFAGRPDGSLLVYDCAAHSGYTVRAPELIQPAQTIASIGNDVWWSTREYGVLYHYRLGDREVRRVRLAGSGANVRGISCLSRVLIVWTGSEHVVVEPETGESRNVSAAFPPELSGGHADASWAFASDGTRDYAAVLNHSPDGWSGQVWAVSGDKWDQVAVFSTPAKGQLVDLVLDPNLLVVMQQDMETLVQFSSAPAKVTTLRIGESAAVPPTSGRASLGADGLFWCADGTLMSLGVPNLVLCGYLPINDRAVTPVTACAADRGVWIATATDIRHIRLDQRMPRLGYSGFVRVPLAAPDEKAPDPKRSRLIEEALAWRGTPYKFGGVSRGGVDCSGLVMRVYASVGLNLPHQSQALVVCRGGRDVHTDLLPGDVLVYKAGPGRSGHCMLYMGQGQVTQAVDQGVTVGSVWGAGPVTVRRFLPDPPTGKGRRGPAGPGINPFELAFKGDVAALRRGVSRKVIAINQRDSSGSALLHWAVDGGHTEPVRYLLTAGADVNAAKRNGVTPLHIAVARGNLVIVRLLMRHGANPKVLDQRGRTPISMAAANNKLAALLRTE